jgi:hypothetical protein
VRAVLLSFLFLLSCAATFAQDTEFWFVAPHLGNPHDRPVYFMITAGDLPATVTVEMPALTGFNNRVLHLAASQSERIVFGAGTSAFENAQMDTIQNNILNTSYVGVKYNRGIHFTATAPVTVYYQVDAPASKDMFALKGTKALGTDFYTPFQTRHSSSSSYPNAYAQFHIVATENHTEVKITPAANIAGTNAGMTKTVILNRGETFAARTAAFLQTARLAGSHIESDKPVAVTVSDDLLATGGAADVTGDQIVPVNGLGTTYAVVRGFSSTASADYGDQIYILATQNNTSVSINGSHVTALNAGQQYFYPMQTALTAVITADHPVYVYQLSGYVLAAGGTERGAALVPSMYSISSRRMSFYKDPASYNNSVFVLVRDGNEDGFTVNGSASVLLAGDFSNIPNMTGWKYARKNIQSVANGTVTVANSKGAFSLGYFYTSTASGTAASFGYFSQYGTLSFSDTTYLCDGGTVTLDAGYAKSYNWTLPDGSNRTTATVVAADTGTYTVTVDQDPFLITTSTHVLRRFEASGLTSSGGNGAGAGTYTYTADAGLYSDKYVSYTWQVDGVQAATGKTFSTTWNSDDEHLITLILRDTVIDCSRTHTLAHHKLPDNIVNPHCYVSAPGLKWETPVVERTGSGLMNFVPVFAGDLDGDSIPELVTFSDEVAPEHFNYSYRAGKVRIFPGRNRADVKTIEKEVPVNFGGVALGRVKISATEYKSLIFLLSTDNRVYAYSMENTTVPCWTSNADYATYGRKSRSIGLVDFDGDGYTELYVGNTVFDAATGNFLCRANTANEGVSTMHLGSFSSLTSATDIDNDGLPELLIGNTSWRIRPNRTTPSLSRADTCLIITPPFADIADGHTQAVDLDLDGYTDVVVSKTHTAGGSSTSYIYVWSYRKKGIIASVSFPSGTAAGGKGIPFIGDINGDGYPDILVLAQKIWAYGYNGTATLVSLWGNGIDHTDESYGTGMTLFDFNQDGIQEIVYRDQDVLRIINGSGKHHETGLPAGPYNLFSTPCYSATLGEYPIVIDVDKDNSAEIVVTGSVLPSNGGGRNNGSIFIIRPPGPTHWAPTRRVWNQFGYNSVNVNEDLTIPRCQLNPATVFPGANGSIGDSDDLRPYNGYLMQQTTLHASGKPVWITPDAELLKADRDHDPQADTTRYRVTFTNRGDAALHSPVYITMAYNPDYSTSYHTDSVMQTVHPGDTVTFEFRVQDKVCPPFIVEPTGATVFPYIILNSRGEWPAANAEPAYVQPECSYSNNRKQLSRAFGVYNGVATVQEYRWVEIDALKTDSLPAGYPAGAFSLLDSVTAMPVSGSLYVEGTGLHSRFIYVNEGAARIATGTASGKVDSFSYRLTYLHPTMGVKRHTATVYIWILEGDGTAACYNEAHTVRLARYGNDTRYRWYLSTVEPTLTNHFLDATVYSPGALLKDTAWRIRPGGGGSGSFAECSPGRIPTVGIFPPGLFTVHVDASATPSLMRWKGDVSSDWRNPQNWAEYIPPSGGCMAYEAPAVAPPSPCRDVEIPTLAPNFPELTDTATCREVALRDRAMLKNVHLLKYRRAKVELIPGPQERDRFLTVSAPLQHTYTGDYHFTSPASVDPQWGDVYMHFFRRQNPDDAPGAPAHTTVFSETFGHPGTHLPAGHAFNLRVTSTSATRGQGFVFPRAHLEYRDAQGKLHPTTRTLAHRFITEELAVNSAADTTFRLPVNDDAGQLQHTAIQVVNPYMAYLDMKKFFAGNSSVLMTDAFYEWDGYRTHTFTPVVPGAGTLMPPLRSFFVQKKTGGTLTELVISPNWTTTKGRHPYILRAGALEPGVLRIRAVQRDNTGEAQLHYSPAAAPSFSAGEDLRSLFYSANPLMLYTFAQAAPQTPLALNASGDFERQTVSLGLYVKESGEVTLEFSGMETFGHNVFLHDRELGNVPVDVRARPLYTFVANRPQGAPALELLDRFTLTFEYTGVGLDSVPVPESWTVTATGGFLHVHAAPDAIRSLEVYNTGGALVYRASYSATDYRIPAVPGQVCFVKARTAKGSEETKKAMNR